MNEPKTADVMCRRVVTAVPDTPFRELVCALIANDVSDIPVIDSMGRPVGVVSDVDVTAKLELHGGTAHPPVLAGARGRARWRRAAAVRARELMTTPALIVTDSTPLCAALRVMTGEQLNTLCVVNRVSELVGVLTRRDAMRVFLRDDDSIQADVERALFGADGGSRRVVVHVAGGVVTLDGSLRLRSAAERAEWIAHGVPGVIAVHNNLSFEVDDLMITGL